MKTIYLIGGTMGVGKTAVCQCLKKTLDHSVFLDGDWCWDADPFQVTDETKRMVLDNICHVLNNFIHCSAYENILFCWVMHQQEIIDEIVDRLDRQNCTVRLISLVCDEETLKNRLQKDIDSGVRSAEILARSVNRIPMYRELDTIKIDTSRKGIEAVAREIMAI